MLKFNIPSNRGYQLTECISTYKLPLALAKINITKRMERDYPSITGRLELYQDKCADVLSSVFIDRKTTDQIITDSINSQLIDLLTSMNNRLINLEELQNKKVLPEKKYSRWKTKTFTKLSTLLSYVNQHSEEQLKLSEVISLVIKETEDTYNIEMNDYVEAYKSEFSLETSPYVIDVINHYKDVKNMFTFTLNSIMERLHIVDETEQHERNIFDELAENLAE